MLLLVLELSSFTYWLEFHVKLTHVGLGSSIVKKKKIGNHLLQTDV